MNKRTEKYNHKPIRQIKVRDRERWERGDRGERVREEKLWRKYGGRESGGRHYYYYL